MRLKKAIKIINKHIKEMVPDDVEVDIENLKQNKEETIKTALMIKNKELV